MKNHYLASLIFLLLFPTVLFAQTQPAVPSATPDDVVKITTKLVQVDAVVTDKSGKQVTDLKASDFKLLQDGKPQTITSVVYVNTDAGAAPGKSATKKDRDAIPTPASVQRASSSSPGRLITFIVDDGNCTASQSGMIQTHDGLKKFVNEQMQPGDRVAIYRTRAGSSMLQQYMTDKTQLLRSVDQIRWYPPSGGCPAADGSFYEAANVGGSTPTQAESDDRKTQEHGEDFSKNNQINGTLGVLNYVVKGLERVGGRKVVFFMSDGLAIRSRSGEMMSARDVLRTLSEQANRAGVVFNAIDVRGVFSTSMIEARDEVHTARSVDVNSSDSVIAARDSDIGRSEDGMYFLADQTGGRYYKNTNDLAAPIKRVLGIESGYYLIGYEPSEDTFRGKHFNKIEVSVDRPDITVRSRPGFDAVIDQPARVTSKRTADSELYEAIAAPLPVAGLDLQLTAYFGNSPAEGNFIRSLIHIGGDAIKFEDDPATGMKKASFDVVAVTADEKNKVVDEFTRAHTYKIAAAALPTIRQNGLIYATDVPIKKPGTYNFRVVIRDNSSTLLGSSSQIIDVPDLKKGRMYLSGLNISPVGDNGKFSIPGAVKPENALVMTATTAAPAIRKFQRGAVLAYSYVVYNAPMNAAGDQPNISVQMRLYHNGQLVSDGTPAPAKFEKQPDMTRAVDFAYLKLNAEVDPGDYTLQLIVRDLSSPKAPPSSQSVDFEVLP
jgi:VWFA-related protein